MLSHDMRNLAAALELGADAGHLTANDLREISSRLVDLAGQVRHLEDAVPSNAARMVVEVSAELPSNVVALARKLGRKGVTVGLPAGPNGGNAA